MDNYLSNKVTSYKIHIISAQKKASGENHECEAYLVIREEPFITIVVGVFGVVLIHSSSVSWTKVETEKDQDLLEREDKME